MQHRAAGCDETTACGSTLGLRFGDRSVPAPNLAKQFHPQRALLDHPLPPTEYLFVFQRACVPPRLREFILEGTTINPLVFDTGDFQVGAGDQALDGWIDEVRLTDRVLVPSEFLYAVPVEGTLIGVQ